MNQTPPNDTLRPEQNGAKHEQASAHQSQSKQREWVKMPEQLPQWLSKRIEFSVPFWVLAIATVILTILVFD